MIEILQRRNRWEPHPRGSRWSGGANEVRNARLV